MCLCLIIFLLILPFSFVNAEGRDVKDVISIAQRHWESNKTTTRTYAYSTVVVDRLDSLLYLVRRTTEDNSFAPGFVIVPACEALPEILAYADNVGFPSKDIPKHTQSWLDEYAALSQLDANTIKKWIKKTRQGYEDVMPLLDGILWGQDEPYNSMCPLVGEEKCPTGCVATALAQIMNYYDWPQQGSGSIQYRTDTHNIPISYNFDNFFIDWDNIHDVYGYEESELENGAHIVYGNRYTFSQIYINEVYSTARCEIKVTQLYTNNAQNFRGDAALMLADEDGNIVRQVSDAIRISNGKGNQVFSVLNIPLAVPASLADGKYRVYCALRKNGEDFWEIARTRGNSLPNNENYQLLEKDGRNVVLKSRTFPCAASDNDVKSISSLMSAVGAAVRMDYAPSGSGANNYYALKGMREYLGYDRDMSLMDASDFTDSLWHNILQKELSEGRPVYYTGSDARLGHAFVIDGMQTSPDNVVYYHINWGWDGLCDGYYLLNMLCPEVSGTGGTTNGNYSNNANMIIGIMPEDGVDYQRMVCGGITLHTDSLYPGQNIYSCVNSLYSGTDFEGKLNIVLQSRENSEQIPITIYTDSDVSISETKSLKNHKIMCIVPNGVPSGDYELRITCTNTDGFEVEVESNSWPLIHIKNLDKWYGGEKMSVLQCVGMQDCRITKEDYPQDRVVVNIGMLWNVTPEHLSGKMALLICNDSGTMLAPLNEQRTLIINGYTKKLNYQIGASFAKDIPDGNYLLCVGYQEGNSGQWTFGYEMDNGATSLWDTHFSPFCIPFEVRSGDAHFSFGVIPGTSDLQWTGIESVETQAKDVYYKLNGTPSNFANDDIYIINNKKILIKQKR